MYILISFLLSGHFFLNFPQHPLGEDDGLCGRKTSTLVIGSCFSQTTVTRPVFGAPSVLALRMKMKASPRTFHSTGIISRNSASCFHRRDSLAHSGRPLRVFARTFVECNSKSAVPTKRPPHVEYDATVDIIVTRPHYLVTPTRLRPRQALALKLLRLSELGAVGNFLVWGCFLRLLVSLLMTAASSSSLQFWGCFSTPKHLLVYGLEYLWFQDGRWWCGTMVKTGRRTGGYSSWMLIIGLIGD